MNQYKRAYKAKAELISVTVKKGFRTVRVTELAVGGFDVVRVRWFRKDDFIMRVQDIYSAIGEACSYLAYASTFDKRSK